MEERNDIIGYVDYEQYKNELRAELQREAEGFVRIGYLLKVARDTGILRDSGYSTVNEFAAAEFELDASQVSRFMNINDRFSQGGYSEKLAEKFKGIGYAKLALMLTLPDAINEEISASYSKSEIQEIKEEVEKEKKITDIEVILEGQKPEQEQMDSTLQKAIHQLGHDLPELYEKIHRLLMEKVEWHGQSKEKELHEILAPAGESTFSVRLQGVGRFLLVIKEAGGRVTLTNIRSEQREVYEWCELVKAWEGILSQGEATANYEALYGESYPAEKNAPEQKRTDSPIPDKLKKQEPAKRKQSKVIRTEERQKAKEPKEPLEQLAGQTSVEEHPEWLPKDYKSAKNETETVKSEKNLPESGIPAAGIKEDFESIRMRAEAMASAILSRLVRMKWKVTREECELIRKALKQLDTYMEQIDDEEYFAR